jgi:hypothetical protein
MAVIFELLPPPRIPKVVGNNGNFGWIHVVCDHFSKNGCRG